MRSCEREDHDVRDRYGSFAGRTVLMEVVKHHDWPGIVAKVLDRGGDIEPGYAVAGEIGYDVPCDRDAALLASGEPRMMLGA